MTTLLFSTEIVLSHTYVWTENAQIATALFKSLILHTADTLNVELGHTPQFTVVIIYSTSGHGDGTGVQVNVSCFVPMSLRITSSGGR